MKIKLHTLLSVIVGFALAFVFISASGCAATSKLKDVFYTPSTVTPAPVTNTVAVYDPADILVAGATNYQTGIILPTVPKPGAQPQATQLIVLQPPPTTHYEPSQQVTDVKTIASAVPGYGPVAGMGVALLASLGKLWLNRKEKPIIATTFQTIEDWANAAEASGDPKAMALAASLKKSLEKAHDYADLAPAVANLINAFTGHSSTAKDVTAVIKSTSSPT